MTKYRLKDQECKSSLTQSATEISAGSSTKSRLTVARLTSRSVFGSAGKWALASGIRPSSESMKS